MEHNSYSFFLFFVLNINKEKVSKYTGNCNKNKSYNVKKAIFQ